MLPLHNPGTNFNNVPIRFNAISCRKYAFVAFVINPIDFEIPCQDTYAPTTPLIAPDNLFILPVVDFAPFSAILNLTSCFPISHLNVIVVHFFGHFNKKRTRFTK